MSLKIFDDYDALSAHAAACVLEQVRKKPDSTLCLAAGDTPRRTYEILAEMAHKTRLDFSGCTFFGLDEWIGIPPWNKGSCAFFLQHHLFSRLPVDQSRIHLFNALLQDPEAECDRMNALIRSLDGIDLMLVGVGMNGHIGFNEPGVSRDLYAHVIALDESTQSVGQKYFNESTSLKTGITLGLTHLMESRKVIMMASGLRKAPIIKRALEGTINTAIPASIVRDHPAAEILLDRDAASLLGSA